MNLLEHSFSKKKFQNFLLLCTKWTLVLLFFYLCYQGLSYFCKSKTGGFSLNKITSDLCFNPDWEINAPLPDFHIFEQKFYYLGSGGQAFAFVSSDGKYVLKFFQSYARFPRKLVKDWPLFSKKWKKEKEKTERDFKSYQLAFQELSEESALLYLHLNPTKNLIPAVIICDPLGIEHKVLLDEKQFALQMKAEPLYPYLSDLLQFKNKEKVKKALSSLLSLLKTRLKKRIYDEDAKLHRNCGFFEDRAIFIDIGRFCRSSKTQTLEDMTERLKLWLKENDPEIEKFLTDEIKNNNFKRDI